MQLGNQNITAGDTRRYQVDYTPFLQNGDVVATFTVVSSSSTSTAQGAFLDVTDTQLFFFVTAGAAPETFTVAIKVTDSIGQTINDTAVFTVVPTTFMGRP
jgi:hypothetical protein